MLLEKFVKSYIKWWTSPVHSMINCVLQGWMPGVVLWQRMGIVNYVNYTVAVLKWPEITILSAISDTKDQVASPFCVLHPCDWVLDRLVPLKNVSQNKSKRIADSTLSAKCIIRVWNSNLWNCESVLIYAWNNSQPACKSNIHPCVAILVVGCLLRMIDNHQGVFSIGPFKVPVKRSQLNSLSGRSGFSPSSKHWTGTLL